MLTEYQIEVLEQLIQQHKLLTSELDDLSENYIPEPSEILDHHNKVYDLRDAIEHHIYRILGCAKTK